VDPRLQPLLGTVPAWLEEGGPEGDVVVASRVRLARNLAGTPFPAQMQIGPASDLVRRVAEALPEILRRSPRPTASSWSSAASLRTICCTRVARR
jgi:protein-arginine kinase